MKPISLACVLAGLAVAPGCSPTSDASTEATTTAVSASNVGNTTSAASGGGAPTLPTNLADGLWTIAPTGDGWTLTDSFSGGGATDYTYSYTSSSGSGSMIVTNGPTQATPVTEYPVTPATVAGFAAQRYSGDGVYWITLDEVKELQAVIETDSERVLSEMEASLTVVAFDGPIDGDAPPMSTAVGGG